jgi:hypothetical protein
MRRGALWRFSKGAGGRSRGWVGAAPGSIPSLFLRSPNSAKRFWEFFTANIRNRNTRRAYLIAVSRFCQQGSCISYAD